MGYVILFSSISVIFNRRYLHSTAQVEARDLALFASLVLVTAILCEAIINPIYEYFTQHKLWEYRLLPIHHGNVSWLACLVWTCYGAHLYLFTQTLDRWLVSNPRPYLIKAGIIGVEAPLIWEVTGNIYFLLTLGEYYAYYLPNDVFHLTSLQVVPIYACCVYAGLYLYDYLRGICKSWLLVFGLFSTGLIFLGFG